MAILCQLCKSAPATVHITDIPESAGENRERHLCESCAEEEGITMKQHEPINAILAKFVQQKIGAESQELVKLSCPTCGISFREFRKEGLFGCPHDYRVFNEHIQPLIQKAHGGGLRHVGKVPKRLRDTATSDKSNLLRLQRQLSEAVDREDYEFAADLRDQIKALQ
jgi:protein arginine kinase activator